MPPVKLQILLKRPLSQPEENALRATLNSLGITVTAAGSVTLSATVSPEDFERLFGQPFAGHGFAADLASAAALPVPAALRAGIESITTTPRLQSMER